MIDGNISEFIEYLNYGDELYFEYDSVSYFIQGWVKNDLSFMVLDKLNANSDEDYVWQCTRNTMKECADDFLHSVIWNGNSFLQIEKEVRWFDP